MTGVQTCALPISEVESGSTAEVTGTSGVPVLPVLLPVQISGELKVPVPGENKRQWDRNWAPEVPSGSTGPGTGTSGH